MRKSRYGSYDGCNNPDAEIIERQAREATLRNQLREKGVREEQLFNKYESDLEIMLSSVSMVFVSSY